MGPSGSGKSTLLHVIGLLDRPTAGRYLLSDLDVTVLDDAGAARVRLRQIGFVFQTFHLIARLSAADNLAMPMVLAGVPPAERQQRVRLGGNRFRIIGVAEAKGVMLGFDLDDTAFIPADQTMKLFNKAGLMEIDLHYQAGYPTPAIVEGIRAILIARHGSEDFTITTQDQMLGTLGAILNIITWSVAALGGISLFVGAIGILTTMTIAVQERTSEIGLLRAIGASQRQITAIFISEAGLGGMAGLASGFALAWWCSAAGVPPAHPLVVCAHCAAQQRVCRVADRRKPGYQGRSNQPDRCLENQLMDGQGLHP